MYWVQGTRKRTLLLVCHRICKGTEVLEVLLGTYKVLGRVPCCQNCSMLMIEPNCWLFFVFASLQIRSDRCLICCSSWLTWYANFSGLVLREGSPFSHILVLQSRGSCFRGTWFLVGHCLFSHWFYHLIPGVTCTLYRLYDLGISVVYIGWYSANIFSIWFFLVLIRCFLLPSMIHSASFLGTTSR